MTTYKVRKEPNGYIILKTVERIGQIARETVVRFPAKGTTFPSKATASLVCYWLNN